MDTDTVTRAAGRIANAAAYIGLGLAAALLILPTLPGCTRGTSGPTPTSPPAINAVTDDLCDAAFQGFRRGQLASEGYRVGLTERADKPGVEARVRDAVVNVLYPTGSPPRTPEEANRRYTTMRNACIDAGWTEN